MMSIKTLFATIAIAQLCFGASINPMQNTYHTSIGAVNTLVQRYNEISEETIKAWRTFLCSLPGVKGEVVDEVLEQAKSLLIEASNLFCSLLSSTTNEQIIKDDCKKGPLGLIFNHLNSLGGLTDVDLLVIDNELNDKLEPEIVEEIMIILHMLHIDESSSGKLQGMYDFLILGLFPRTNEEEVIITKHILRAIGKFLATRNLPFPE